MVWQHPFILHPTCTCHPRVRKDFWIQNSRLFPDFFSKQKFLFPEPCPTIPLPATLASPLLPYHPYQLPSIPFPLPYHTLCLHITIPLPLHCHPPTSCLTIPLTCLTITLLCLTTPNMYPLSFFPCFTSPYAYALQYFYPLPYHSLLLYLTCTNSFVLPYHTLLSFFALLSPTPLSYTTVLTNYLDSFVI